MVELDSPNSPQLAVESASDALLALQELSQMEFGILKAVAGAPEPPPEALTTAPKMVPERALVREPRTGLLSLWALSFGPWLSFAGDGPLTW